MQNARTAPAFVGPWTRLAIETLPADLTAATPPQVDEVIRTADLERAIGAERHALVTEHMRRATGQTATSEPVRAGSRTTRTVWSGTIAEALDAAKANPAARVGYQGRTVGDLLAELDTLRERGEQMGALIAECDAEYTRRDGWTRYFRVANANGHVHTSTACRTTYPTTQWNWPTGLSGGTDADVVDAAGALTCLTCFPSVREDIIAGRPIVPERFETPEQTAHRAEREAEAKAKRDAKIAKGVTPDGAPLVVAFGGLTNEIKTERAAELRYVDCAWDELRVGQTLANYLAGDDRNPKAIERMEAEIAEYAAAVETLARALAWKRGTTVDTIRDQLAPKVDKRVARGY